jgi:formiminotetrahydrofolate cyclodeaminase
LTLYEQSLADYLDRVASKSPTPGGGSVSAIVAGNAAAMVEMVANLTLDKKGYEQFQPQIIMILDRCRQIRNELKVLTARDMEVFEALMRIWRLRPETEAEQGLKAENLELAVHQATEVPLEISGLCLNIMELAAEIAAVGNKNAISDAGVGVLLAEAALQSALLSVDINLPSIRELNFRESVIVREELLKERAAALKEQGLTLVKGRI